MELGRALAKLGQREAALKELEQALTMDVEDINAHLQKVTASDHALDIVRAGCESPARAVPALSFLPTRFEVCVHCSRACC